MTIFEIEGDDFRDRGWRFPRLMRTIFEAEAEAEAEADELKCHLYCGRIGKMLKFLAARLRG